MKITVVGTGYVGLVSGACFSEMGNHVCCVDVDAGKIERLKRGEIPIYEPGLDALVTKNQAEGRLKFTTDLSEGMKGAEILFIAVGTPPGEDGSADLSYVLAVAKDIGRYLGSYLVIVNKSTVPVGTAEKVSATIQQQLALRGTNPGFDVVSNPEFLKEGAAIDDFMKPDRIIIGTDSDRAREVMSSLYAPFNRNHERVLVMGVRDAEMTKYVANCMLATKISFMNEIANLCDRLAVDVESVRRGIGSDSRIGFDFIYPGVGYGGSCFPKDVKALVGMSRDVDYQPFILNAVEERNRNQKRVILEKVAQHFGGSDLAGRRFAVWGLSFKPGTDDMREAPSHEVIGGLLAMNAEVCAFDPVVDAAHVKRECAFHDHPGFSLAQGQYEACEGADALILLTEWKPFRQPDISRIAKALRHKVVFDGRNALDKKAFFAAGFRYSGIGR